MAERPSAQEHAATDELRNQSVPEPMPFEGDFNDACEWCEQTARDYGNEHAAMIDLLFSPPEDYSDPWLSRLWDVGEFVRAQPCQCKPNQKDADEPCERCRLLNLRGAGR